MNLYLFVSPQNSELPDHQIWNDCLYHAAVWETSTISAKAFAKDFYPAYHESWVVRQVDNPERLNDEEPQTEEMD
jgi:hypothetical protein